MGKKNLNSSKNPEFLNEYLVHVRLIKLLAERTIEEYYFDIRMFLKYLYCARNDLDFSTVDDKVIKELTAADLRTVTVSDFYSFFFYVADERGNNERSRYRKTCTLRSFFKYLHKTAAIIPNNPALDIEVPSPRKALPKYLSLTESKRLLKTTRIEASERDYCILVLLLNCGLRLSEVVGLNITGIDFTEKKMRVFGKGSKERIVYLNKACVEAIKAYLPHREIFGIAVGEKALFISRNKRRISKRRVQQVVEEYIEKAGLGDMGITTHKLRHTAATLMYQYGSVDLITLKEVLGHESIATTEIYTHLSNEIVRDAFENNPLADIVSKN